MGLLDFFFRSKKEREQEKHVKDVLNRTDDLIERTERKLYAMQRNDEMWRKEW